VSSGMRLDAADVGGAVVVRRFTLNGEPCERNKRLTRDEVLSIPVRNREALVSSGIIREFPLSLIGAASPLPSERFVVRRPDLRFDVVQGFRVNDEPLHSKADAEALAHGSDVEPKIPRGKEIEDAQDGKRSPNWVPEDDSK
jgi:hypothetical protein